MTDESEAALERFEHALSDALIAAFKSALESESTMRFLAEQLRRDLLAEPLEPASFPMSELQKFLRWIQHAHSEIHSSLECLAAIPIYARRFPYRNLEISRSGYLSYHIHGYLQEIYILRSRMETFVRRVARAYRREERADVLARISADAERLVRDTLESVCKARGYHVHESRYEDSKMRQLETLELHAKFADPFAEILELGFREIRKDRINWMNSGNAAIQKLVGTVFWMLEPELFPGGKLRTPRQLAE